jgi:hypothetical protein
MFKIQRYAAAARADVVSNIRLTVRHHETRRAIALAHLKGGEL